MKEYQEVLEVIQESSNIDKEVFYNTLFEVCDTILYEIYPNRHLYFMDPKSFGETWAEKQVESLHEGIKRVEKGNRHFHHDLLVDDFKVEVKASRAVCPKIGNKSYWDRSLNVNEGKNSKFMMNFNHIFFDEANAFVFVAVWKDVVNYYVMSSKEVEDNPYLYVYQEEYQMAITENNMLSFEDYMVEPNKVYETILFIREQQCQNQK